MRFGSLTLGSIIYCLIVCFWATVAELPLPVMAQREGTPIQLRPQMNTPAPASGLTIEQAIEAAVRQFPSIPARRAEMQAAKHGVTAQKFAEYMPSSNYGYQLSAGSHNRLSQALFRNVTFPELSGGAKLDADTMHGRAYTAQGILLDWTPLDLGLHKAMINRSRAALGEAERTLALTQFDVQEGAANAFLTLIVAKEQVRAAESTVKRFEVLLNIVETLVHKGLRPGVDESLSQAQLLQAKNNLFRAQQAEQIAEADLAEALGTPEMVVTIDTHPVSDLSQPPVNVAVTPTFTGHPLALQSQSVVALLQAEQRVYNKSYQPVLHFMGDINFRGSGLGKIGLNEEYTGFGFVPAVTNWLVGVELDFPFLDWFKIRQQTLAAQQRVTAERYNYQQIIQTLQAADRRSKAMLEASIKIAENMPQQVTAAQEAEMRARIRYRTGLISIADVAETENILTETLVEQAVARVAVWKSLLAMSDARGDIRPFLAEVAAARNRGM